MCGIVGIVSKNIPVVPRLLEGLNRLEYRGYDSAGIATLWEGRIVCRRAAGKIVHLKNLIQQAPLEGNLGIAHTRWATHGAPVERNAHPQLNDHVAVVHNGIIENFQALRHTLTLQGRHFTSETDTEVLVHLITHHLEAGLAPLQAFRATMGALEGAFAIAVLFRGQEELLIGARRGSPLVVGYGEQEHYLGSDALALTPFTSRLTYLEEGDWVALSPGGATIYNEKGIEVARPIVQMDTNSFSIGKEGYPHFMLKEIFDQPGAIGDTLASFLDPRTGLPYFADLTFDIREAPLIRLIACGTSYLAAMVAKYWLEQQVQIPVDVDLASEFRYRAPPLSTREIAVFISQSGETADTLAALSYVKARGVYSIAIVNVATSSLARMADMALLTSAGLEISVASTKGFTTQLVVLGGLSLFLGLKKGTLLEAKALALMGALTRLPSDMQEAMVLSPRLDQAARKIAQAKDVLYIGRGSSYPVALEGALKLKELSYIHAEGFAAGELKHGPIALIDSSVPLVVVSPPGLWFEKTLSNVQEARARGGQIIFISDREGCQRVESIGALTLPLPLSEDFTAPILYTLPLQLLAYQAAVLKGRDVDQPRNLAKSVTVE